MEEFGMPMGPAELADTVGLDICVAAARRSPRAPMCRDPRQQVALAPPGQESGQGIYRYREG